MQTPGGDANVTDAPRTQLRSVRARTSSGTPWWASGKSKPVVNTLDLVVTAASCLKSTAKRSGKATGRSSHAADAGGSSLAFDGGPSHAEDVAAEDVTAGDAGRATGTSRRQADRRSRVQEGHTPILRFKLPAGKFRLVH